MPLIRQYQIQLLLLCQLLFFVRVVAQVYAGFFNFGWLPNFEAWYSGLIPYVYLFPIQLIILMLMSLFTYGQWQQSGPIYIHKRSTQIKIRWCSAIYFLVMLARFIVQMIAPEKLGDLAVTLPIYFHWVLAGYLFLLTLGSKR